MKNKILPALISLVIAFGLWLYVVTVVSPNSDKTFNNVPVVKVNENILQDRGFMVTDIDVNDVSVQLGGTRSELNTIHTSGITVSVDLSKVYEAGVHTLPCDVSFGTTQNSISVLNKDPASITVTVEERVGKPVPVSVLYNGTVDDEFVADKDNKVLSTSEINIIGPKSIIDSIFSAQIAVDLTGRSESINENFPYTLCDSEGKPVDARMVTTDTSDVNLVLRILRMKEIKLYVNVVNGGGATAENSTITLDTESIWVSGSDNLLENFENLEIGTVELGDVSGEKEFTFPIKLPEGISDETGITEVKVTVKIPELETKVITVKSFVVANLPNGYKATIVTKAVDVTVRGPKASIDALEADDLTVTADFTETDTGSVKAKVTVVCNDPLVGEIGSYSIAATVSTDGE